jgi:integrating conjugative element membrane protein (TIGR03747 family)
VVMFEISTLVAVRLFTFLMNLPFLLSMLFIAIVDGLSQRDIRKFQVARESAFFFHRVKSMGSKIFYLLFFLYLSLPFSLSPLILLLPMASLISITTMLTIKSYKKYL